MKYLYLMVLGIMLQQTAFTQQRKLSQKQVDEKGKIVFAVPEDNLASTLENELSVLHAISSSDKRLSFRLAKTTTGNAFRHNYYNLFFMNLEIVGVDYVVHAANGKIVSFANGSIPDLKDSSYHIKPQTGSDEVKASLLSQLSEDNKNLKASNGVQMLSNKGLVWFYRQYTLRLAYRVEVESTNPFQSGTYIIDAMDGKRLEFYPDICTGYNGLANPPNSTGVAQTLYSGVQNIVTDDNFNGGFRLRQVCNGVNVLTLNANNQQNPETIVNTATDFFDNDNNWQAVEHGSDRYATDVHWATQNVITYWQQIHNRNSIDGNGMTVRGYVHTYMPQFNNVNAFWSRTQNSMYYADGNLSFGPIAAFDVVAHEFGHGVCQYTSNLNTGTAESAALSEGFSDIWGATIEAWAAPAKQRWLIGEDIFPYCLRNLQEPNDPFASEGSHPDTYLGNFWRADGESHNNSTVLSHWFFLLSEGGNGTNDLGNPYSVTGIGITNAARIAYLTEQLLNSSANYAMARTMSIQAAIQLFGNCSNEVVQVTNAWFAVGVGAAWASPSYQLNTSFGQDCNSATVTANFPGNANVIWTTTNGLLINGYSSPYTIQSNSVIISSPNGEGGSVSASLGGTCFTPSISFCPCETWDNPTITWIWSSPMSGEPLQAQVSPECPNAIRYEWYINGQLVETTYSTLLSTYNWPCTSEGEGLSVIAITSCGVSAPVYGGTYSPTCYQYGTRSNVRLYPNPVSSQVVIGLEDTQSKTANGQNTETIIILKSILQIKIIDKMGVTKKMFKFSNGNKLSTLNVSDLPSDIYYLDITDGSTQVRKPLLIRR